MSDYATLIRPTILLKECTLLAPGDKSPGYITTPHNGAESRLQPALYSSLDIHVRAESDSVINAQF